MIWSEARHIAVPPMVVARELPWPPPATIRSVSPWRRRMRSLSRPADGPGSAEGRLVALADMLRAGDQGRSCRRPRSGCRHSRRRAAGALDVIGEAQPAQLAGLRSRWRRAEKPARSACASAWSKVCGKAPLSTWKPKLLVIGIALAGTMLRRRSPARSKPKRKAAASINRSRIFTVSAKPGPRHADRRGVAQHRHDMQRNRRDAVRCPADGRTGRSARHRLRPPCKRRDWPH